MDATFAELVDRVAREAGLNDYQLAAAIGLLPGRRVFSSKQVARLRRGEQRHLEPELVHRLIEILDLDPPTAWHAAGLWPPGLTAEQLRTVTRPEVPALATAASATSRRRRSDRPIRAQGKRTQDQLSVWPWSAQSNISAPFIRSPRSNVIAGPWLDEDEAGQKVA